MKLQNCALCLKYMPEKEPKVLKGTEADRAGREPCRRKFILEQKQIRLAESYTAHRFDAFQTHSQRPAESPAHVGNSVPGLYKISL